MQYRSTDEFLRAHSVDLVALMALAQCNAGGYFGVLPVASFAGEARSATAHLLRTLQEPDGPRAFPAARSAAGAPPRDQWRRADEMERLLLAFVAEKLDQQPDLCAELVRRIHHAGARSRTRIASAEFAWPVRSP